MVEPRRGPGEPDRRDRGNDPARHGREGVRARRRDGHAARPARAAGTCPSATCSWTARSCPARSSTSGSTSSTTAAGRSTTEPARTSTCRSSRATSRRASGTTRSTSPRTSSACRAASIRATVLIEHVLAAFEMDEILWELREHAAGLNAGRWDYIFSVIKTFPDREEFVLPDRAQVTMTVPFMRGYTELLVRTTPPARRARDGRDGRVRPEPARRRGERARARACARGQGARGGPGLRRHLGRASRPRPGRDRGVRPRARRPAEPGRAAARRRELRGADASRRGRDRRRRHRRRRARQRERRAPLHRGLARAAPAPSRSTT